MRMVVGGQGDAGDQVVDRCGALVSLARLDLQQSQNGRMVGQFHPALAGQADVLGQVIHSSCKEKGRS